MGKNRKNKMKLNLYNISIWITGIFLLLVLILMIYFLKTSLTKYKEYFPSVAMPFTTIYIAFMVTLIADKNNKENENRQSNIMRIDESSGWRKQVLSIASTYSVDMDTICALRACLGPEKTANYIKDKHDKNDDRSKTEINIKIEYFRKTIIIYCDSCIRVDEVIGHKEITRIMARYLLKAHWSYYIYEMQLSDDNLKKYVEDMEFTIRQFGKDLNNYGVTLVSESNSSIYSIKKSEAYDEKVR